MNATTILLYAIQFVTLLFAISVHESAHAWMADKWGDPTARYQGRITLNPIAHIDLMGTIVFPIMLAIMHMPVFGWAKPVMINPYNLRNRRTGSLMIAAAGPVSNFLAATAATGLFLLLRGTGALAKPPLPYILYDLIVINLFLAVFNLIPIPPLDGSGILEALLRGQALRAYESIRPYGFLILLAILYLHVLDIVVAPLLQIVNHILGVL
jgi:Zn-dependent protease